MKAHELIEKLKKIRLLVMDVDGTLTDSAMYYSANGEELKRFNTRDGMGIGLLRKSGIKSAILTSENSEIVRARAKKLKIETIVLGSRNKTEDLKAIAGDLGLELEEVAYIGDDVNDEHAMKLVGVSACPSDAVPIIRQIADYICLKKGGFGAVREFAEVILQSQNKLVSLTENW